MGDKTRLIALVKAAAKDYDDVGVEDREKMVTELTTYHLLQTSGARQTNVAASKDSDATLGKVVKVVR